MTPIVVYRRIEPGWWQRRWLAEWSYEGLHHCVAGWTQHGVWSKAVNRRADQRLQAKGQ